MSERKLSSRSIENLTGVHPDLIRVVLHALQTSPIDFTVIEGKRSLERQKQMLAQGSSQTMNSRHLYGLAVDLLPIDPQTKKGKFDWGLYNQLAPAVKEAASLEGVPIVWGGDWTTLKDGPHFELPHGKYPNGIKFDSVEPLKVQTKIAVNNLQPAPPEAVSSSAPVAAVNLGPNDSYEFGPGSWRIDISSDGRMSVRPA